MLWRRNTPRLFIWLTCWIPHAKNSMNFRMRSLTPKQKASNYQSQKVLSSRYSAWNVHPDCNWVFIFLQYFKNIRRSVLSYFRLILLNRTQIQRAFRARDVKSWKWIFLIRIQIFNCSKLSTPYFSEILYVGVKLGMFHWKKNFIF